MNVLVGVILMPFGAVLHSRNISSRDVRAVILSQQADAEKGAMELRKKPQSLLSSTSSSTHVTPILTRVIPSQSQYPSQSLSLQ
jgi:hypothetical protein